MNFIFSGLSVSEPYRLLRARLSASPQHLREPFQLRPPLDFPFLRETVRGPKSFGEVRPRALLGRRHEIALIGGSF
jgi:hypothetical protein